MQDYSEFDGKWGANAELAWDTIVMKSVRGIPAWMLNVMDHAVLEKFTGNTPGAYRNDPVTVYRAFQLRAGVCMIDQWIPRNPLDMGSHGYEAGHERGATTGVEEIVRDGMRIDSPESVVEHMEKVEFPRMRKRLLELTAADSRTADGIISREVETQKVFGPDMLKVPYFGGFPGLRYWLYGYVNYFMAYALYPEVMGRDFALQADIMEKENRIKAQAIVQGGLPKVMRLDHDMADSRSTLVNISSLDAIWFPHFARAIKPFLDAGIRLLWHCDGNLMQMVPRLIEAGIGGFQGFQYEAGMDYEKICAMTDRNGDQLMIWAGVSVTTTLPHGTQDDVRREMKWLVEKGPKVGMFLGGSSSITPGTNPQNIRTLIEGLHYYREHGRG